MLLVRETLPANKGSLFEECDRWKPQIRSLERYGEELGVGITQKKTIHDYLRRTKVTKVILQFLKDIGIGKCSNDIPLRCGS
jgi:hypothetical protein